MDSFVAKFELGTDIRRARLPEVSFEAVRAAATMAFGDGSDTGLELKYVDDEGDLCTLTLQTFEDFLELNRGKTVLRVKVVKEVKEAEEAADEADAVDATMDDGDEEASPDAPQAALPAAPPVASQAAIAAPPALGAPPAHDAHWSAWLPWWFHGYHAASLHHQPQWQQPRPLGLEQHLPQLVAMLQGGHAHMAALFAHFGPLILPQIEAHRGRIDRFFGRQREVLAPVVDALREGMQPFLQFQEAQLAFDRLRHDARADGAGEALCSALRTLATLPADQRCDVAEAIFGRATERFVEVLPALMAAGVEQEASRRIHGCDACGAEPVDGHAWKCTECNDYELCAACYGHKDDVHHPGHTFQLATACGVNGSNEGRGNSCGKGLAKGVGKFGGGGNGKGAWGSSSSTVSSDMSSSSGVEDEALGAVRHHKREQRRTARAAAKRRLKAQIKEARLVYKQEKRRWRREPRDVKVHADDHGSDATHRAPSRSSSRAGSGTGGL